MVIILVVKNVKDERLPVKNIPVFEPTYFRLGKHKQFLDNWDDVVNKLLDKYEGVAGGKK